MAQFFLVRLIPNFTKFYHDINIAAYQTELSIFFMATLVIRQI